jgi:hypothetical protein
MCILIIDFETTIIVICLFKHHHRISSLSETIHRLQSEIASSRTSEKQLEEALLQVEVKDVDIGVYIHR